MSATAATSNPPNHNAAARATARATLGVAFFAMVFTVLAAHGWEDYYITFRISRNLVEGHGLVFQPGEAVHSFTSPIGTLLPAAGFWLTGSEAAALWLLRILSIAALVGAAALIVRRSALHGLALGAALAFALLDSKTLTFATNGMETGLYAGCVALVAHELWTMGTRRRLPLALGFAGLMWTRPDGMIPAMALLVGTWVFLVRPRSVEERRGWWRRVLLAALIGAALYAPWVGWAWSYYGSPLPNTIMAKSAIAPPAFSVVSMLLAPVRALLRPTAMDGLFMPTFFVGPDWPEPLELLWRVLARLAAFAWLWPAVPARARAASLAVLLGGVYLQHIMMFSWYYAPWTLLGGIALGGVVQAALMTGPRFMPAVRIATAIAVVASVAVVACAVQTARVQRRLIHEQGLESIGLWLRANAQPRDTVFLEPLGYIGYYSGLKMLDFPGLSAPEVTRLIRGGKRNYRELIEALHPTWLVLRPTEVAGRRLQDSATLQRYDFVRAWDQQPELDAVRYLPNRRALEYDAVFLLFRRKPETASPPRGSGD